MPFTVKTPIGILLGALATAVASASATAQQPGQSVQVVRPGESIQAAIDDAEYGGRVFVLPGVYRETADAINGLTITKGIDLIGLSTSQRRVILENAGDQRNGIVVVPAERTNCLSCHANLAPPFDVLPGVARGARMREPMIRGMAIRGITIRGFRNNGLFTENVDGFSIDDVESVDNANYGIFPTLSKNGVISRSRATGSGDSGIWVETSQNVVVSNVVVEGNLIGLEVSNSDDVSIINSESRNNSLGISLLVLPFLFDERPGARRITLHGNFIHDNNRENDAPAGSLLGGLPSGVGLLNMGVDDSLIANNRVEGNNLSGITLVDACIAWAGTRFDCAVNPRVTPEFLSDQDARNNRVAGNVLVRNATDAGSSPFAFAASDLTLLSLGAGNCFTNNRFTTSFSLLGFLPTCP